MLFSLNPMTVSGCLPVGSRCWEPRATGGDSAYQPHRVKGHRVALLNSSNPLWSMWEPSFGVRLTRSGLNDRQVSSSGRPRSRQERRQESLASSFDCYSSPSRTSLELLPNTWKIKVKLNLIWLQFVSERANSCSFSDGSVPLIKSCIVFVLGTRPSWKRYGWISRPDWAWKGHDNEVMRSRDQ